MNVLDIEHVNDAFVKVAIHIARYGNGNLITFIFSISSRKEAYLITHSQTPSSVRKSDC